LVAPVLLMATVILSYLSALGVSWLLFEHVFGYAAIDVQLPLVGFLFLVAIGIDYNIFLMSRVREEATGAVRPRAHARDRRGPALLVARSTEPPRRRKP
jgi:RND superfamily putative drug exporter